MTGKVKWFNDAKGFGFAQSGDREIFLHYTSIQEGDFKSLNAGDAIEFDLYEDSRGRFEAKNIKKAA